MQSLIAPDTGIPRKDANDVTEPATILIVDDDPANIEVLSETLEAEYDILFALNGEAAIATVQQELPALIILDVVMPGMDGHQVCEALKTGGGPAADIPVIFVTALGKPEDEARGLELGAIDYVAKPVNPPMIQARVRNHMALIEARAMLAELAVTDAVTGLANRRQFEKLLGPECRRRRRHENELSIIRIDVDHFKMFVDAYGHPAGDDCLARIGAVIGQSIHRPLDLGARYGGGSFACMLPDTNLLGAKLVGEVIRSGVAGLEIANAGSGATEFVTASLGAATVSGAAELHPFEIVAAAESLLARAKEMGRNQVHSMEMQDAIKDGETL